MPYILCLFVGITQTKIRPSNPPLVRREYIFHAKQSGDYIGPFFLSRKRCTYDVLRFCACFIFSRRCNLLGCCFCPIIFLRFKIHSRLCYPRFVCNRQVAIIFRYLFELYVRFCILSK